MKQPLGSKLCGHYCVAKLAGITPERAIELVGHRKGTRTKELVRVFRSLGFVCANRLYPLRSRRVEDLGPSLLKLTIERRAGWHWIAWTGTELYDPAPDLPVVGRVTSYLEISRP